MKQILTRARFQFSQISEVEYLYNGRDMSKKINIFLQKEYDKVIDFFEFKYYFNYGKKFEEKFREDWKKAFPDGTIDRLYDTTAGYKSISTVSDYICYNYPLIYYIEEHKDLEFRQ